jgi:hypothetical protein
MNARQELDSYVDRVQRRLRLDALSRGTAVIAAAALAATILLVLVVSVFAFSDRSLTGARVALGCCLALAVAFGIAIPLRRVTRRHSVARIEQISPEFEQRLVTFADKDGSDPFAELLAADTLAVAKRIEPSVAAPRVRLAVWCGAAGAAVALLLWLVMAAPGLVGYGAHQIWLGSHAGAAPLYDVRVSPGNATVRRHSDQPITARPIGMLSPHVILYARYASGAKWEQVPMQPRSGADGFEFVFTALPENVEYYVEADARRSPHYTIRVVDQPTVQQIKVTYHYPAWTGLKETVEDHGGDLRALEGTRAELEIVTDRPLKDGLLALGDGRQVRLTGDQNHYRGDILIDKEGVYHIAALDQGQPVRMSEDFFIQPRKADAPVVAITRPGGDYRASPIEEVTVAVRASDEFSLKSADLHYSVNGGPEQTISVLPRAGDKEATGSTVIALEDLKLVPGDIVSVYATARDARAQSHTDMAFIQVDPFEREFSQSQQSGEGGGAGGGAGFDPSEISRREKEIIAQTFRQQNSSRGTDKQSADTAKFLSDVQTALRNQSLSLAGRLEARELASANGEFNKFEQEMSAAAAAMGPAASKLQQQMWRDAVPEEEKALQHLLRAEATFRQIEVAFGSRGGGSGGAGAGRDLASLFDLELDTQKNQYETQQSVSSEDQRAQAVDDALQKLDALARRQDDLAQRQRNGAAQTFEQRWQQEMLQREAEQLQRQVEQLARSQQQGGSGQSAPGQSSPSGQPQSASGSPPSGQSGQPGARSSDARARAAQQALDRLRQAQEDMRRASEARSPADARLAAERLREAGNLLGGLQSQEAAQRLAAIARDADRLAAEEKVQAERVARLRQSPNYGPQRQELITERQRLADDLASLEQNMRNAARELNGAQRAASDKLRSALDDAEQADLETRLQRTADWLRNGTEYGFAATEQQIASGLQRLRDAARDAQQAVDADGSRKGSDGAAAALDNLERLRRQLEALRDENNTRGQGQPPSSQYQTGALTRNEGQGQLGSDGRPGNPGGPGARNENDGRGAAAGDLRPGGASGSGYVYGGMDTGNNARPGSATPAPRQSAPALDPQQTIQQGVSALNQLSRQVKNDPQLERDIQQMISEMEHLDLRRFPGNPAMVEELHQRLLSGVDALELRLRRQIDEKGPGQVRSADSSPVPSGYEDAVAEYFRRLSTATPAKK